MGENKEEDLNNKKINPIGMRHIARAGLGFVGGFFTLFGAYAFQSKNYIVGSIAVVLGIAVFIYAYKG